MDEGIRGAYGRPVPEAYAVDSALAFYCSTCGADPGKWCGRRVGQQVEFKKSPHTARLIMAHRHRDQ